MYVDQPHHHVQELLNRTLWPDQPLGRWVETRVIPNTYIPLDRVKGKPYKLPIRQTTVNPSIIFIA